IFYEARALIASLSCRTHMNLQLAAELGYPISEATSGGILTLAINLATLLWLGVSNMLVSGCNFAHMFSGVGWALCRCLMVQCAVDWRDGAMLCAHCDSACRVQASRCGTGLGSCPVASVAHMPVVPVLSR